MCDTFYFCILCKVILVLDCDHIKQDKLNQTTTHLLKVNSRRCKLFINAARFLFSLVLGILRACKPPGSDY